MTLHAATCIFIENFYIVFKVSSLATWWRALHSASKLRIVGIQLTGVVVQICAVSSSLITAAARRALHSASKLRIVGIQLTRVVVQICAVSSSLITAAARRALHSASKLRIVGIQLTRVVVQIWAVSSSSVRHPCGTYIIQLQEMMLYKT